MKMLVIKETSDVADLKARLLGARLDARTTESALESLRRANPHVDLQDLRPGTVLLVPDNPSFKAAAGSSLFESALDEFTDLVKTGLNAAVQRAESAREQRAAENTEIGKAIKTAAFKRALENEPELRKVVEGVTEALKKENELAAQAAKTVADTREQALDALKALEKLLRA